MGLRIVEKIEGQTDIQRLVLQWNVTKDIYSSHLPYKTLLYKGLHYTLFGSVCLSVCPSVFVEGNGLQCCGNVICGIQQVTHEYLCNYTYMNILERFCGIEAIATVT